MKCPVHIGTVMRCPECFHWDAMKARAERAEAQLKTQAESGIWTTVEDMAKLHERIAQAEAQAAAIIAGKHPDYLAHADLMEAGRKILDRLRMLVDALRKIRDDGVLHYPPHSGEWRNASLRQRQTAFEALARLDAMEKEPA